MLFAWSMLAVTATVVVLLLIYTLRTGIPSLSSSGPARRAILSHLPDTLPGPILDLGAGWGALLFLLARRYPETEVVGIELSPVPWLMLHLRRLLGRHRNVTLHRRDFLRAPLQPAGAVVCFLFPGCMRQLRGKFESDLRPGTLVLSNQFEIPGWQPVKNIPLSDSFTTDVFVYRVPDRPLLL